MADAVAADRSPFQDKPSAQAYLRGSLDELRQAFWDAQKLTGQQIDLLQKIKGTLPVITSARHALNRSLRMIQRTEQEFALALTREKGLLSALTQNGGPEDITLRLHALADIRVVPCAFVRNPDFDQDSGQPAYIPNPDFPPDELPQ